ncbi:MAG: AAA family ATPase [Legionellales bacterium]|nr:AAA family ATPase [Legionellales bacterium]
MSRHAHSARISFTPVDNERLASLCGPCNQHLQQIEHHCGVAIHQRSHMFQISGKSPAIQTAKNLLHSLYQATEQTTSLTADQVHRLIRQHDQAAPHATPQPSTTIKTRIKTIQANNPHQSRYIQNIQQHPINFSIGPAGTGKTYLAVACAAAAFDQGDVERLIFVRPAVEAGEKLGFLPGDMVEKVLPYLRPIYDALYELLGFDTTQKLIDRELIEIAPLAFMRGRTLNNAFIILDEAQNTTPQQMQMFLTRIGFGSTAVITGDITQVDLPNGTLSGLRHAEAILKDFDSQISFNYFTAKDVMRHPLVGRIIEAYQQDPIS